MDVVVVVMTVMVGYVVMVLSMVMVAPVVMMESGCVGVVRIEARVYWHFGQVMGFVMPVVVPLVVLEIASVYEVTRLLVVQRRASVVPLQAKDIPLLLNSLLPMARVVVGHTRHCKSDRASGKPSKVVKA